MLPKLLTLLTVITSALMIVDKIDALLFHYKI